MEPTEEQEPDYSDFFNKNYPMLLATFLEDNHKEFMEHVRRDNFLPPTTTRK